MSVFKYYNSTLNKYVSVPLGVESVAILGWQYKTTETIIGEWINGKPIYRQVLNASSSPSDIEALVNKRSDENGGYLHISQSKPTNSYTNTITIVDGEGNNVYSKSISCTVYGIYSEVTDTFIYRGTTYTITSEGTNSITKQSRVSIFKDSKLLGEYWSVCNGSNSSYSSSSSDTLPIAEFVVYEYTKTTDEENSFDIDMLSSGDLDTTATDDEVAAVFS